MEQQLETEASRGRGSYACSLLFVCKCAFDDKPLPVPVRTDEPDLRDQSADVA